MPIIRIENFIKAPPNKIFDLCLDMNVHQVGMSCYREEAIGGVTKSLISLGDNGTWRAKHFGFFQKLTVQITELDSPIYFADEMIKGTFKRFKHSHFFNEKEEGMLIVDGFDFNSPLGVIGKLVDKFIMTKYMTKLLIKKNKHLKRQAQS